MTIERIMRTARPYAAAYMQDRLRGRSVQDADMRPHADRDGAAMFLAGYAHARMCALLEMPALADEELDLALADFPKLAAAVGRMSAPPVTTRHRTPHHNELSIDGAFRRQLDSESN